MEVLRSGGVLNVAGKVVSTQRKLWEVKVNEGSKETKRDEQEKEAISSLSNVKPKRKEKNESSSKLKRQEGDLVQTVRGSNEVVSKILTFFKKMMSICSLEAELRFQDYSVTVKTSGNSTMQLARCRLILDVNKGKIKLKIHKSAALSVLVPSAVTRAVSGLNTALSCIPLQNNAAITKVFTAIFKLFTSGNSDDVTSRIAAYEDVIARDDVVDEDISLEQALSKATFTSPSKLFSTLLALDVKIICPKGVVVELRKRQILAVIRRQTVVLDAKQGLQIVKEPRAILRREKVDTAIAALSSWISSCPGFNIWQNTFEVVKCLQVVNEH
ncbi:hypothetical protein ACROYT_G027484 [Oculina patagonica]